MRQQNVLLVEAQGAIIISGGANRPVTVKLTAYRATPDQVREARGCFGGVMKGLLRAKIGWRWRYWRVAAVLLN